MTAEVAPDQPEMNTPLQNNNDEAAELNLPPDHKDPQPVDHQAYGESKPASFSYWYLYYCQTL